MSYFWDLMTGQLPKEDPVVIDYETQKALADQGVVMDWQGNIFTGYYPEIKES